MLTLYFSPGSSAMATHIALHEIGVPFEPRPLSFATKDQRNPDYLGLNPEGKVPALIVDGQVLTEVAGTLYYLAKRYPEANLWPEGGIEVESQAISWMSFIASTIHPARRAGVERWKEVFTFAEKRLAGADWTAGARYSISDIHLFRLYWRFVDALGREVTGPYPALTAHYDRIMRRPAVKKTIEIEAGIGYTFPTGAGTDVSR
jgi:glutathione S-transferase